MLQSSRHWVLGFLIASLPASVAAQSAGCGSSGGSNISLGSPNAPPFTAVVHATGERRLFDGNVIRTDLIIHQARDSAGRVRSESVNGCSTADDGSQVPSLFVSISDPANRSNESWMESPDASKAAQINHYPPPSPPSKEEMERQMARAKIQRVSNPVVTEKLGSKMIAGIATEGTRHTRTIPAGQMGNDRPIEMVDEEWVSRSAGITLLRVSDNPMMGRQTVEVTSITMGEPDPKLFAPPADYKVYDYELKTSGAASTGDTAVR